MNQGRIWCVVHPTVGLPLLLGSVTTISLLIHGAVLTHTTWYSSLYQGGSKTKTAANETTSVAALQSKSAGFSITVKPMAKTDGSSATAFVVTVGTDGGQAAPVTIGSAPLAAAPPGHLAMAQAPAH